MPLPVHVVAKKYLSTPGPPIPTHDKDTHPRTTNITPDNLLAVPITSSPSSPAAQPSFPFQHQEDPIFELSDPEPLPALGRVVPPVADIPLPSFCDLTPAVLRSLITSDYGNNLVFPNSRVTNMKLGYAHSPSFSISGLTILG